MKGGLGGFQRRVSKSEFLPEFQDFANESRIPTNHVLLEQSQILKRVLGDQQRDKMTGFHRVRKPDVLPAEAEILKIQPLLPGESVFPFL
jgi:hypothetical protein